MKSKHFFSPHILIGSSLIHFFWVLFQLNFSIKRKNIIRLIITFFILLMFTPFRIIESILYLFSKKEKVKAPIFIVGHPRSGTTYFHDSLNEIDSLVASRMIDCLYPFMNKYFKFLLVPILEKVLPETRLMDKMAVSWDSPQEEEFGMELMNGYTSVGFLFAPHARKMILDKYILLNSPSAKKKWQRAHLKFAQKIQSINKGKTLVFKSPSNTAKILEILEIYPDAKFIHIVRNPLDVIPSTLHLYQRILPEFSLQNETNFDLTSYVYDYYSDVMGKFLNTKGKLNRNQFFELKYEDFVEQPITLLKTAFNQLEINADLDKLRPFFDSRKNFSKNKFEIENSLEEDIKTNCALIFNHYQYN